MASPSPAPEDDIEVDASEPFKGVIVCCTSIPPEHRTDIAHKVAELGGVHKYDLTPDVTHLVVGDYDTPKYRHVARERPDIKPMDAGWIDAVNELWKKDDKIRFAALERSFRLRALETCGAESASQEDGSDTARGSLLICLTGFGDQRDEIAEQIRAAGGRHTGDLTRRCTHLIASRAEGKKFTAAKSWGLHTVTLDWLLQSIERGMILDEARFDPLLPPEEQGVGAWTRKTAEAAHVLGKRARSAVQPGIADDGGRKLRKTASLKLSSQTSHIWGDILGRLPPNDSLSFSSPSPLAAEVQAETPTQPLAPEDRGVFASCTFVIHGFPPPRVRLLEQTIATMSGSVAPALSHASMAPSEDDIRRFLLVPQTSQPDTHPQVAHDGIHVVTEFYVETCLHHKRFVSPLEHVLGRPFPLFPIPAFSRLTICTAAFTGIELNHVSRGVEQLGATYDEAFRKTASVLVCKSLAAVRREKLKLALQWAVPVVPGDWLWACISTGFLAPPRDHVYPELRGRYAPRCQPSTSQPAPPPGAGVDTTAFDPDPSAGRKTTGATPAMLTLTLADFAPDPSPPPKRSRNPFVADDREPPPPVSTKDTAADPNAADDERLGLTSALSGLIQPPPHANDQAAHRPRRRGQKILGRAISNVSNASSTASTDGVRVLDSLGGHEDDEPTPPPPATQLEYGEREAQGLKAALMSKMAAGRKSK